MIPAAPIQPLGRWEKMTKYMKSLAKVVISNYF
jgi:hypothetical protein